MNPIVANRFAANRPVLRAARPVIAAAMLAAGLALPASAADMSMPPAPVFSEEYKPEMVEIGSGWYLRGDVGYAKYSDPKVSYANIQFSREKIDAAWSVGGGFGYKFVNWFRVDATLDYRFPSTYKARADVPGFFSEERAKITSYAALLNAYLDLGSWSGLSPYVGAGVGVGGARAESYVGTNYDAATGAIVGQALFLPKEKHSLAWALMAGVAVDVGSGFQLDFGYRYLNLGDFRSQTDLLGNDVRFKDLNAHEFRVGLRYMID